jgi:hypothetical protein
MRPRKQCDGQRCQGARRDGKRCRALALSTGFCPWHVGQSPARNNADHGEDVLLYLRVRGLINAAVFQAVNEVVLAHRVALAELTGDVRAAFAAMGEHVLGTRKLLAQRLLDIVRAHQVPSDN